MGYVLYYHSSYQTHDAYKPASSGYEGVGKAISVHNQVLAI